MDNLEAAPPGTHEQAETDRFEEITPNRDNPRADTALFKHARQELIDGGYGCWIGNQDCDHKNPVEAHHYFCEWSKSGAADWDKLKAIAPFMVNPQNGLSLASVDWEAVKGDSSLFVDSKPNLLMLCSFHHRNTAHGIHHIPFSLWLMQKFGQDGFEFTEAVSGK